MLGQPYCPSNIQQIIDDLVSEISKQPAAGQVANYIPALAEVDPNAIGVALATINGECYTAGDAEKDFSIQSIAKIYALVMAMLRNDDSMWERVRMEPSGQAFNSIVQLESEQGIPRNPMINAGAIVVADMLVNQYSSSNHAFLQFIQKLCAKQDIHFDEDVFVSEQQHGHRNAAMAHLMKAFDNIHADVDEVLAHYFFQCSLAMSCKDLANSLLFLANKGKQPKHAEPVCSRRDCHRINAILSTSGMYDQSGEFAFQVGLPAKSGVGGGIVAIVPGFGVIAVYSPRLNQFGNSHAGMQLITGLAQQLGLSVY